MPYDTGIAERGDWKTHPLPEKRAELHVDRTYSPEEMALIRRGLIPEVMEDKWFIFFEGDTLYCHRSWTGYCIYEAHFEPDGDRFRVARLLVNRDPENYTATDDERDAALFVFMIDTLLLGNYRASYPEERDASLSQEDQALGYWSFMGRAMLGDGPSRPDPDPDAPPEE